ncbi:uncharacterized protein FOMMEDRAFT_167812 [Fomitiporia mediterranea MF3/22]|uniref:uncharacterized protein n=1 Tax=Fomitiporia mediterranea (strain MF3/22) TaxID=694068 RepID=UPI00044092C1|nr:uncharacterized protein FOMMEDRAFT_167812 [Fomitiporia mediterranea MF3/22]EJD02608.1 hypothetical protein FOMMEDRAFT_167812 [Fomitiporia mediterranea MF3/22]
MLTRATSAIFAFNPAKLYRLTGSVKRQAVPFVPELRYKMPLTDLPPSASIPMQLCRLLRFVARYPIQMPSNLATEPRIHVHFYTILVDTRSESTDDPIIPFTSYNNSDAPRIERVASLSASQSRISQAVAKAKNHGATSTLVRQVHSFHSSSEKKRKSFKSISQARLGSPAFEGPNDRPSSGKAGGVWYAFLFEHRQNLETTTAWHVETTVRPVPVYESPAVREHTNVPV